CWGKYTEGKAPTICLEGKDNHTGSHGMMHTVTGELIKQKKVGKEIKYVTARDMVIDQVAAMYGCDKACLKAQLDKAYGEAYSCGNLHSARINAVSGETQHHGQDSTDTDNTQNEDN
ncbi:hypothetical protein AC423_004771, partial [Salmonella enterica subsp. enterica]|nr:hypothetical protein [Salmonella enterica subsp. enterica]